MHTTKCSTKLRVQLWFDNLCAQNKTWLRVEIKRTEFGTSSKFNLTKLYDQETWPLVKSSFSRRVRNVRNKQRSMNLIILNVTHLKLFPHCLVCNESGSSKWAFLLITSSVLKPLEWHLTCNLHSRHMDFLKRHSLELSHLGSVDQSKHCHIWQNKNEVSGAYSHPLFNLLLKLTKTTNFMKNCRIARQMLFRVLVRAKLQSRSIIRCAPVIAQ